jgi:peroxiredoxin family protein
MSAVPERVLAGVGTAANDTGLDLDRVHALEARIAGLEAKLAAVSARVPSDRLTILVFHRDFDKLLTSFILATGAAAMGTEVSMFFTFWGLSAVRKKTKHKKRALSAKMIAAMLPAGTGGTSQMNMLGIGPAFFSSLMRKKNVASFEDLFALACESGVKMTACQMSMDLMGVDAAELREGVSVGGVATYLADACDSRATLFV